MLNLYLFEIECADEIGNYKLADSLSNKLVKIASSNPKSIKKTILKKFHTQSEIKDISFSSSQQKFIVSMDSSTPNNIKSEVKNLASPYPVSFRYCQKNIDSLMDAPMFNAERSTEENLNKEFPGDEYIDLWDADREPTDDEMSMTIENPPDDLSNDPTGLDQFLLEYTRKEIRKQLGH